MQIRMACATLAVGLSIAFLAGCETTLPGGLDTMLTGAKEQGYEYMAVEQHRTDFVEKARVIGAEAGGDAAAQLAGSAWDKVRDSLKPQPTPGAGTK